MTLKLFWADPSLTRLETRIVAVAGDEVTVAETIFYAFSGGQESDHGTLDGREVLAARKAGRGRLFRSPARAPPAARRPPRPHARPGRRHPHPRRSRVRPRALRDPPRPPA